MPAKCRNGNPLAPNGWLSRGHEACARLVCPSRTSARGGDGDCVKEGGGAEGEREMERALGLRLCHRPRPGRDTNITVSPHVEGLKTLSIGLRLLSD